MSKHIVGPETLKLAALAAGQNGAVLQGILQLLQTFGPTLLQIIETYLAGHGTGSPATPTTPASK